MLRNLLKGGIFIKNPFFTVCSGDGPEHHGPHHGGQEGQQDGGQVGDLFQY